MEVRILLNGNAQIVVTQLKRINLQKHVLHVKNHVHLLMQHAIYQTAVDLKILTQESDPMREEEKGWLKLL